jgi:hypothetical protein
MGKADQSSSATVNVGVAVQAPTLTEEERMRLIPQRERSDEHKSAEHDDSVIPHLIDVETFSDNIKQK